jgi:hypothetical protein
MDVERLRVGVGAVGTTVSIPYGLTTLYLLGVGLDLFFDRHDSERR